MVGGKQVAQYGMPGGRSRKASGLNGERASCFQTFLDRRNNDDGCLSAQTLALDRPTRVGDRRHLSTDLGDRAAHASCPSRTYPAPGNPTTHHALALAV